MFNDNTPGTLQNVPNVAEYSHLATGTSSASVSLDQKATGRHGLGMTKCDIRSSSHHFLATSKNADIECLKHTPGSGKWSRPKESRSSRTSKCQVPRLRMGGQIVVMSKHLSVAAK